MPRAGSFVPPADKPLGRLQGVKCPQQSSPRPLPQAWGRVIGSGMHEAGSWLCRPRLLRGACEFPPGDRRQKTGRQRAGCLSFHIAEQCENELPPLPPKYVPVVRSWKLACALGVFGYFWRHPKVPPAAGASLKCDAELLTRSIPQCPCVTTTATLPSRRRPGHQTNTICRTLFGFLWRLKCYPVQAAYFSPAPPPPPRHTLPQRGRTPWTTTGTER